MSLRYTLPAALYLSDDPKGPLRLLEEEELYFVLSGHCRITDAGDTWTLSAGDLLLCQRGSLVSFTAEDAVHVRLCMDCAALIPDAASAPAFTVNSVKYPHADRYGRLRMLLARLVRSQDAEDHNCSSLSVLYDLLSELLLRFPSRGRTPGGNTSGGVGRRDEILAYISEHYREGLTLSSVAEAHFLSVPYLSTFFSKHLGTTFTDYYNTLRLDHAVAELLTTDHSIEEVAENNGFSDPRGLLRLFKQRYHTLPSSFRKEHADARVSRSSWSAGSLFFPSVPPAIYLPLVNVWLDSALTSASALPANRIHTRCDPVSFASPGRPLLHSWRRICAVSSARALLFSDMQETLRTLQREIGFEYISFYGLLNIDNYLYAEDAAGTPRFTFTLVDKVLDFLVSIGLKPMINLSYMPWQLGEESSLRDINYLMRTTPPRDYEKWAGLITALTRHLIERYSEETVSTWLFHVWKKPEVSLFSIGEASFQRLYETSWRAVKSVSRRIPFGTPSLAYNSPDTIAWDERFLTFCRTHRCMPDFLCFSYYNDVFDSGASPLPRYLDAHTRLQENPNAYLQFIDSVETFQRQLHLEHLPSYMVQWNLTVSQRNPVNDTCFLSAYVARHLLETYDRLQSFCYWSLSDYAEETELPAELFFGGIGLFTHNGIRKPCYYAFAFASLLQSELCGQGDGWFVTKNTGKSRLAIYFYNYEHYSPEYARNQMPDLYDIGRYAPFVQQQKRRFSLKIEDLPGQRCSIREHYVNRLQGSAYDEWNRMGRPQLRDEDLELLRSCAPGLTIRTERISNGILMFETELEPLEIRLVEIEVL